MATPRRRAGGEEKTGVPLGGSTKVDCCASVSGATAQSHPSANARVPLGCDLILVVSR